MTSRDDNYYIGQVLKGDSSAYAMLVEKHQAMVFNIAVKILRSREEAEDLAQEVFLKAYQSLKEFEGKARFQPGCTG